MNTILQKRIEEASIEYTMKTRPMCIAGDAFADMARELNKNPAFIEGANFLLQNQWISVEEALPKEKFDDEYEFVFVIVKTDEEISYYDTDYIRNGKWELHNDDEVTHWMSIPRLKGGEK